MLTLALPVFAPAPAMAQGFGWWQGPAGYYKAEKKKQSLKRSKASQLAATETNDTPPKPAKSGDKTTSEKPVAGPLILVVSLKNQRVTVYDINGTVTESPISSGRAGLPTPMGVFTILEKERMHYSNLYDSAPMPNMQRITWSGVAMHAGVLPGYPASHGCIRLPHGFSQKLYGMTKVGNRVIVTRDSIVPQTFAHDRLFRAYPPENELSTAAIPETTAQVADASSTVTSTLGVASAVAAESQHATPGMGHVAAFREARKAEMTRLAEAIKTAEAAKIEATNRIPAAAKAAEDARNALKQARAEAERLSATERKAASTRDAAKSDLDQLARRMTSGRNLAVEEVTKAAETEDKLEASIIQLTSAAEAAAEEAKRAQDILKDAEAKAMSAEADRKAAVNGLGKATTDLQAALAANDAAKRREAKRALPVSVLISRQTGKLYVRQGYEPILESPVTIDQPDRPLGTHVFTAMSLKDNKADLTWNVVSVPTPAPAAKDASGNTKKHKKDLEKEAKPVQPPSNAAEQTAASALDRITVPDEVRDQISDLMKPGSSLVISDNGLSGETGKFTDFIVSLR